jgi:hypothetical protein
MGTWGNGNLECDGVQDALAGICDDLFARVIELLQHPRSHQYDDEEIDELFAKIEMIFALGDRGMINSSPNPKKFQHLLEPWLQRWTDYNRESGSEPLVERAKVIRSSFNRMLKIAEGSSGGSLLHRMTLISEIMSNPKKPRE